MQIDKQRAVIPAREAKGGITRAIYFPTERSLDIIKRLITEYPTGLLFRNNKGNPWTGFAVKSRFERLQIAVGRHEMAKQGLVSAVTDEAIEELAGKLSKTRVNRATGKKTEKTAAELRREARLRLVATEARPYAKRHRQYDLRHTFVIRKLKAGVDSHLVAALTGHRDTKMIDKVYSHVADDHQFMLEQAKKEK